jgi:hypothetical protein
MSIVKKRLGPVKSDVWAMRLVPGQKESIQDVMDQVGCRSPSALMNLLLDEHYELKRIKLHVEN